MAAERVRPSAGGFDELPASGSAPQLERRGNLLYTKSASLP